MATAQGYDQRPERARKPARRSPQTPVQVAPQPRQRSQTASAEKKKAPARLPAAVFAPVKEAAPASRNAAKRTSRKSSRFHFFGTCRGRKAPLAPAEEPAAKEDTMSLPLLPLDGEAPAAEPPDRHRQ